MIIGRMTTAEHLQRSRADVLNAMRHARHDENTIARLNLKPLNTEGHHALSLDYMINFLTFHVDVQQSCASLPDNCLCKAHHCPFLACGMNEFSNPRTVFCDKRFNLAYGCLHYETIQTSLSGSHNEKQPLSNSELLKTIV